MRVGLDATPLIGPRTGIGQYVAGLLSGLAALPAPPDVVLTAFTWRGISALPAPHSSRRFPARGLQALWQRVDWPPAELLSGRVDVFHATNYVLPPTRHAAGVLSIHDLTYELHADTVTPATLRYRVLVPRALRRGALVLALTETVAAEVRAHYGLAADRVMVAPPGVDGSWFAPPGPRPAGLPAEYLLFVGNREPRKNLPVLLEALRRLGPDRPPLVLAGPPGWGPELDLSGVVVPGYLSGPQLRAAVGHAAMLVFPSRYEGFGLPPVEAFACGRPVVASDIPVLREVLGSLAVYAEVGDPDSLAAAIGTVLATPDTAAARAARRAHAATYSWTRCARATMAAYVAALER